jgi:hypothetical protein
LISGAKNQSGLPRGISALKFTALLKGFFTVLPKSRRLSFLMFPLTWPQRQMLEILFKLNLAVVAGIAAFESAGQWTFLPLWIVFVQSVHELGTAILETIREKD